MAGDGFTSNGSASNGGAVKSNGALPVTLLSGFLGSGKTTLLKHILTQSHGYRIAVIVNDIGAINIDAKLIQQSQSSVTRSQEKLVELQNGCICCTLRGDLLEKLVELARDGCFEYVLIESSGISEPEQVAETFDPKLAEAMEREEGLDPEFMDVLKHIHGAGGVGAFAKLDTTVTVIDAFSFHDAFDTSEMLSSQRADVDEEDERHVSHLMVDQIEFADIIVLNKVSTVSQVTKESIRQIIKSLNHRAEVIETDYGVVDVGKLMNTGAFDIDVAQTGAGWLQDLNDLVKRNVNGRVTLAPKPETEEYGINNFVWSRRRPMHPRRLFELIHDIFILANTIEGNNHREDEDSENDDSMGHNSEHNSTQSQDTGIPDNETILKNKKSSPLFGRLFRSKGGIWLASRPHQSGDWSQAGAILTLQGGHEWYCRVPRDEWSGGNKEIDALIEADMVEPWGDRQQQLVMIGEHLNQMGIEQCLDSCLLNDAEMAVYERIMTNKELSDEEAMEQLQDAFEDGFPDWEDIQDDETEDEMDIGSCDHHSHGHKRTCFEKEGSRR